MKIKEMIEQPRSKALKYGLDSLSNVELLALVIENGTRNKSAYELAFEVLNDVGGIEKMKNLNLSLLTSYEGIKEAKAIRVLSILELAKRMNMSNVDLVSILNARDVYTYFSCRLQNETQENFYALYLDSKNRIIREKLLFKGSLDISISHPREVFKEAMSISASRIIVVHNHPSGDASPSIQDRQVTKKLEGTSQIVGIPLLDHVIIGKGCFYSFNEEKLVSEN